MYSSPVPSILDSLILCSQKFSVSRWTEFNQFIIATKIAQFNEKKWNCSESQSNPILLITKFSLSNCYLNAWSYFFFFFHRWSLFNILPEMNSQFENGKWGKLQLQDSECLGRRVLHCVRESRVAHAILHVTSEHRAFADTLYLARHSCSNIKKKKSYVCLGVNWKFPFSLTLDNAWKTRSCTSFSVACEICGLPVWYWSNMSF